MHLATRDDDVPGFGDCKVGSGRVGSSRVRSGRVGSPGSFQRSDSGQSRLWSSLVVSDRGEGLWLRQEKSADVPSTQSGRVKSEMRRWFGSGPVRPGRAVRVGEVGVGSGRVGSDRVGSGRVLWPWENRIWRASGPWEQGVCGQVRTAQVENTSGKQKLRTQMKAHGENTPGKRKQRTQVENTQSKSNGHNLMDHSGGLS